MEIAPVPRRLAQGERRRFLLALLVLVPVMLMLLVPPALGLDRFVVTDASMDGTVGRGSVVLARDVPAADLEVGDVITFQRPGPEAGLVTRRIVSLDGSRATTQGDANRQVDPWTLELVEATYPRMLFGVPWVGYPFTGDVGAGGWMLLAVVAGLALLLAAGHGYLTRGRHRLRATGALGGGGDSWERARHRLHV